MTRPRFSGVDAVVLTALGLEYDAVRAFLMGTHPHVDGNGTRYEVGQLRGGRCRIALALIGPGNLTAAALAGRAIEEFGPAALMLVGVAGGLTNGVALGDLVVATRIHAYHGGRAETGGFRSRPRGWPLSHSLEQHAREVAQTGDWIRWLGWPQDPPTVHFKPLVSGEVVLDSGASPIAELITEHYNDAVAIDMESAGVAEAAHRNNFQYTITIRGISDKADGTKGHTDTAGWQPRAAATAAAFAVALAERITGAPGRDPGRLLSPAGPDAEQAKRIQRRRRLVSVAAGAGLTLLVLGAIKLLPLNRDQDGEGGPGVPGPTTTTTAEGPTSQARLPVSNTNSRTPSVETATCLDEHLDKEPTVRREFRVRLPEGETAAVLASSPSALILMQGTEITAAVRFDYFPVGAPQLTMIDAVDHRCQPGTWETRTISEGWVVTLTLPDHRYELTISYAQGLASPRATLRGLA